MTRREGRRSVLIDSRTAMNYVMVAPIQAALAEDPRVRFYATSTEAGADSSAIYARALPGTTVISPRAAALKRFDVYLSADLVWARLPRGTRRIQMFHGVAGKFQHDYDKPQSSMRRWHRFFFVNRRRLRNFISAGAIDASSDAPRLVGMPKVDCLVDGSIRRDTVLRDLNLDPDRPTVLYAPTWSAASSLNLMGLELVEGLLDRSWNVIVKLHDRSLDLRAFFSGGVDWPACLRRLFSGKTGRLAPGADICPVPRRGRRDDHRSQFSGFRIPPARPAARSDSRAGAPSAARTSTRSTCASLRTRHGQSRARPPRCGPSSRHSPTLRPAPRRAARSPRISSIGPAAQPGARSTSCTTPWS